MRNKLTNLQDLEILIEQSDQIFCKKLELHGLDPLIIPSCPYTEIKYVIELAEEGDLGFLDNINLKLTISYEFYKNFSKSKNIIDFRSDSKDWKALNVRFFDQNANDFFQLLDNVLTYFNINSLNYIIYLDLNLNYNFYISVSEKQLELIKKLYVADKNLTWGFEVLDEFFLKHLAALDLYFIVWGRISMPQYSLDLLTALSFINVPSKIFNNFVPTFANCKISFSYILNGDSLLPHTYLNWSLIFKMYLISVLNAAGCSNYKMPVYYGYINPSSQLICEFYLNIPWEELALAKPHLEEVFAMKKGVFLGSQVNLVIDELPNIDIHVKPHELKFFDSIELCNHLQNLLSDGRRKNLYLSYSTYLPDSKVESLRICRGLAYWPKNPGFYYMAGFKSVEFGRLLSLLPPDFIDALNTNSTGALNKLYFIKRKNTPFPEYLPED